jgi:hypothetical protein
MRIEFPAKMATPLTSTLEPIDRAQPQQETLGKTPTCSDAISGKIGNTSCRLPSPHRAIAAMSATSLACRFAYASRNRGRNGNTAQRSLRAVPKRGLPLSYPLSALRFLYPAHPSPALTPYGERGYNEGD